MNVQETIKLLENADFTNEPKDEIIVSLKRIIGLIEGQTKQVTDHVHFLQSIALEMPQNIVFTEEDLY